MGKGWNTVLLKSPLSLAHLFLEVAHIIRD